MTFDITKDVPKIHNRDELKMWLSPLYIINDKLEDPEGYKDLILSIFNILKSCFKIRQCREYPIKFKFNKKDKKTYTLQLRHFAINLIVWEPFTELAGIDVLDETYILDCINGIPTVEDYLNHKLFTTLRDYHINNVRFNYMISIVLYNLRLISIDFSLMMGLNFSILTFMNMYDNNKEVRDIMEITFNENMQPYEIENKLSEVQSREIEIYKNEVENPIGVILSANTGIKHKQFTEFTASEGLKPTLDGITIPEPIENSTLLRGLDRPSYLYLDATGARKSLVIDLFVTLISNNKKNNLFNCWKLLVIKTISSQADNRKVQRLGKGYYIVEPSRSNIRMKCR